MSKEVNRQNLAKVFCAKRAWMLPIPHSSIASRLKMRKRVARLQTRRLP
jgi:hypothetical protein